MDPESFMIILNCFGVRTFEERGNLFNHRLLTLTKYLSLASPFRNSEWNRK